jgi:hypothetical protein
MLQPAHIGIGVASGTPMKISRAGLLSAAAP